MLNADVLGVVESQLDANDELKNIPGFTFISSAADCVGAAGDGGNLCKGKTGYQESCIANGIYRSNSR